MLCVTPQLPERTADKIKKLFNKYRELILYVFFGALTTGINWGSYMIMVQLMGGPGNAAGLTAAVLVAQVLSILFAYATNRKWVFKSKAMGAKGIGLEMCRFFGCRGASLILDIGLMYVGVSLLGINDGLMKLASNVVIIFVNYALSKLLVFRQKD